MQLTLDVLLSLEIYNSIQNSIQFNITDVCLSVGIVGMWRANGNPNPSTDLNEILHTHPHLSKEGFGQV